MYMNFGKLKEWQNIYLIHARMLVIHARTQNLKSHFSIRVPLQNSKLGTHVKGSQIIF